MGPPPPLAKAATWSYATLAILLGGLSVVESIQARSWMGLAVFAPISLYCAGLAYGASLLRARTPARPASAWICAPLLLHVLSGALGVLAFLNGFLGGPKALGTLGTDLAMFGMLLGCLPALVPYCSVSVRRAGPLLAAAFVGPLALCAVIWLAWESVYL